MNDNLEKIGQASDRLENLLYALKLPMPPTLHIQVFEEALPEIIKEIREGVIAEAGINPWE